MINTSVRRSVARFGARQVRSAAPRHRIVANSARFCSIAQLNNLISGKKQFHTCAPAFQSVETPFSKLSEDQQALLTEERAVDRADVVIVGGGPAGLAAAIRLKQLDAKHNGNLRVVVLEKSSEFGNHTVSGVILEPKALRELFPEECEGKPATYIPLPENLVTPVTSEGLKFLFQEFGASVPVPEPPAMVNKGKNYIASLSQVVRHLSECAENLGVEVYPGISVSELVFDKAKENVIGVATKDMGVSKKGEPKDSFERGMEFHARQVFLAEGCHGSLTKKAIKQYDLRKDKQQQSFGLGVKEVWEVPPENFKKGYVAHTMGYPLSNSVYGGGFQYHFGENMVTVGLVVGLDYKNPYVSPYQEFQKMKHHPFYSKVLKGGKCISYGARALNEGGYQAIPKLHFPGGALIGASAGFMNVPKIKGTHTAMKSGMLAAESIFDILKNEETSFSELEDESAIGALPTIDLKSYEDNFKRSWAHDELFEVRNIRPSFNTKLGNLFGMCWSGLDSFVLKGRPGFSFKFHETGDSGITETASQHKPIDYPKPDGVLSFDILTSVSRTGTYHDEDEQCHLRVPDQDLEKHANASYPKYKGIEQRFCPAGVYEYVEDPESPIGVKFQINSQNCIHCKTCDIKVPTQDIDWVVPEGGDGPKYTIN